MDADNYKPTELDEATLWKKVVLNYLWKKHGTKL